MSDRPSPDPSGPLSASQPTRTGGDTSSQPSAGHSTSRRGAGTSGSQTAIPAVFEALRQKYRWHLDQSLGEGGFGYVFQEEVGGLERAVKISKSPLGDQQVETLAELRALRELGGHPRLLALVQYEVVLGHLVTVWELAQQTLEGYLQERQRAKVRGGLPLKQLVMWMLEVAEGIDFLNQKGVYHRDIKPRNLFLVQGHAKVGDLGLAKDAVARTMSHTGMGSLGYMPPEAMAGKLDKTIDLFGLAASYVRLRTGQEPFGPPQQMTNVLKRLERGECQTEGMTAEEAAWVRQALAADPAQRPTGGAVAWVRELVKRLQAASAKSPVAKAQAPPPAATQPQVLDGAVVQPAPQSPPAHPPPASAPGAPAFPSWSVLFASSQKLLRRLSAWFRSSVASSPARLGAVIAQAGAVVVVLLVLSAIIANKVRESPGNKVQESPGNKVQESPGNEVRESPPSLSSGVLLIEGYHRQPLATLDEALANAYDGAKIYLAPGEHRLAQPVLLKKSLTLIGPGPEQCRVTCDGEGYVICYFGTGTFAARGIRFEHIGSQAADVLRIDVSRDRLGELCLPRGGAGRIEKVGR